MERLLYKKILAVTESNQNEAKKFERRIMKKNLEANVSRNAIFRRNVTRSGDGWNLSPQFLKNIRKLARQLMKVRFYQKKDE